MVVAHTMMSWPRAAQRRRSFGKQVAHYANAAYKGLGKGIGYLGHISKFAKELAPIVREISPEASDYIDRGAESVDKFNNEAKKYHRVGTKIKEAAHGIKKVHYEIVQPKDPRTIRDVESFSNVVATGTNSTKRPDNSKKAMKRKREDYNFTPNAAVTADNAKQPRLVEDMQAPLSSAGSDETMQQKLARLRSTSGSA